MLTQLGVPINYEVGGGPELRTYINLVIWIV